MITEEFDDESENDSIYSDKNSKERKSTVHMKTQTTVKEAKKEMSKMKNMQTEGSRSSEDESDSNNDEKWYLKLVNCVELPKFLLT